MKPIFFCTGLIFLMFINCQSQNLEIADEKQEEQKIDSMEIIQQTLEKELLTERQDPFITRVFDPTLGGKWIGNAISYGCYRKGQAPGKKGPSEEEVFQDLTIISKYWNLIRVYSVDDDTELILKVIKKHNFPIKVMLGIWLENEANNPERRILNIKQVLRGIKLADKYSDLITAISVGNETQVFWSWHKMNMENLIKYIRAVRNNTNVPVTTADDYNFWNKPESNQVANEIDFIVTHIYPLWNGKTLDMAIDWMDETYKQIQKAHPDKVVVVGEVGWATDYNADKKGPDEQGTLIKGEVSLKAQEKFLISINDWINKNKIITFYFEAFDEPWKGGGENSGIKEIEKNWGVFYEDRTPKESFRKFLIHN